MNKIPLVLLLQVDYQEKLCLQLQINSIIWIKSFCDNIHFVIVLFCFYWKNKLLKKNHIHIQHQFQGFFSILSRAGNASNCFSYIETRYQKKWYLKEKKFKNNSFFALKFFWRQISSRLSDMVFVRISIKWFFKTTQCSWMVVYILLYTSIFIFTSI